MNINCSLDCIYGKNGKCTLDHSALFLNLSDIKNGCAYYAPKKHVTNSYDESKPNLK